MEGIDVHHWQWISCGGCSLWKYGTWLQEGKQTNMGIMGIIIGIRWSLISRVVSFFTLNSLSKYVIIYTYSNNNKGRDVHFPLFCQEWRIRIISFTSFHNYGSWDWILPQPWCFLSQMTLSLGGSEEVKSYHVDFCEQLPVYM